MFAYVVTQSISYSYFYVCVYAFRLLVYLSDSFSIFIILSAGNLLELIFLLLRLVAGVCRWNKRTRSDDDDARSRLNGWWRKQKQESVLLCISLMLSPPLPLSVAVFDVIYILQSLCGNDSYLCCGGMVKGGNCRLVSQTAKKRISTIGTNRTFFFHPFEKAEEELCTMSRNWTHESFRCKTLCWCDAVDSFATSAADNNRKVLRAQQYRYRDNRGRIFHAIIQSESFVRRKDEFNLCCLPATELDDDRWS